MIEEITINNILLSLGKKDLQVFFPFVKNYCIDEDSYKNFFKNIETSDCFKGLSQKGKEKILNIDYDWAKKEEEKAKKLNVELLTINQKDYPASLLELSDPPFLIYSRGKKIRSIKKAVSVVGTRTVTSYGKTEAEKIGKGLADYAVTVVSGMARGCDSAGHRGALKSDGNTIAVLGTGVDVVYPPENIKLYNEIIDNGGSVISEFPFNTSPLKFNFPKRNRIISALSKGVVVVEAGVRSGAMMTARMALEAGKEVMALPGPVTSKLSEGPNNMIKDGAHLIRNFEDILNICYPQAVVEKVKKKKSSLKGEAKKIVQLLSVGEMTMDDLMNKT